MNHAAPLQRLRTARVCTIIGAVGALNPSLKPLRAQNSTTAATAIHAIDSVAAAVLKQERIPGAVVTVVHDGRILLNKGYGVANIRTGRPVDAMRTLFGVASVSKTFTALAALRLAELGTLDLFVDIDSALGHWKPARRYPQSVSVAQLLTHTAGFDDEEVGDAARDALDVEPLETYLARRMPLQIQPPGRLVKYSNHGTTLAGLVVEHAAGVPFADAVKQYVLAPLGMTSSSFAQVLPDSLELRRAIAYDLTRGSLTPIARYFARTAPAWGMSTTGDDMSRFLLAALSAVDTGLLTQATRARWLHPYYRVHPQLPGVTMGLFEGESNGRRFLYHEGGMPGFTSYILLIPSEGIGLFVAGNRRTGNLRRAIQQALVQTLLPADTLLRANRSPAIVAAAGVQLGPQLQQVVTAGTYRFNREAYAHNVLKFLPLIDSDLEVHVTRRGNDIAVDGQVLSRSGSGLYNYPDSHTQVALTESAPSVPAALTFSSIPLAAYTRVAWYESGRLHRGILAATTLLLIASLVTERSGTQTGHAGVARRLGLAVAATHVLFLVGFGAAMAMNVNAIQFGPPPFVRAALTLPIANVVLTAAHASCLTRAARDDSAMLPRGFAVRQATVLVASVMTLASLHYWNLLGWHF